MLEFCGKFWCLYAICGQAINKYLCKCSFTGAKTSKLAGTSWYKSTNLCKVDRQWLNELTLSKEEKQFYDNKIHGYGIIFYILKNINFTLFRHWSVDLLCSLRGSLLTVKV